MKKTSWHHIIFYISIIILLSLSHACSASPFAAPTETPLPTATNTPVPPTDTPEPSSTPDPVATKIAQETEAAAEKVAEIEVLLAGYDIELPKGGLGWSEENEITVSQKDYKYLKYDTIADEQPYKDFILHTDVTWTSTTGIAGCGIYVRSEYDFHDGKHYFFNTMRRSGAGSWAVEYWDQGDRVNFPSAGWKYTDLLNLDQGSTNEYVMVVMDNELTIYVNNSRLGHVTMSSLDEGALAFVVWQESGETDCIFDDTWLYKIDQE